MKDQQVLKKMGVNTDNITYEFQVLMERYLPSEQGEKSFFAVHLLMKDAARSRSQSLRLQSSDCRQNLLLAVDGY